MAIEICFPTKHHQGLKESIHLGVFSRVLKQTVLIPKLKKLNANPESSSIYKPLTFFGRLIYLQLREYLTTSKLLDAR